MSAVGRAVTFTETESRTVAAKQERGDGTAGDGVRGTEVQSGTMTGLPETGGGCTPT